MGVCKCKQRNVTNQFCYVCRMNVCESCMVKDHQRCIIKSYVHWLQDSDFSATCSLCLESINSGEVIRLTCYDLFHWDCFNSWAIRFSDNAKPSNYTCPDCKAQVFPPSALVSPIADVLRDKFATVAWGRKGLGLPTEVGSTLSTPGGDNLKTVSSTPISSYKPLASVTPFVPLPKQQQHQYSQNLENKQLNMQHSDTTSQSQTSYHREKYQIEGALSRKLYDTTRYDDAKVNLSIDHDDNKYKRKGFFHWIGNLLRLKWNPEKRTKREPNLTFKRVFIGLVIFALAFMTVVYFMSVIGGHVVENDPMLDPDLNKNIKVQRNFRDAQDHIG